MELGKLRLILHWAKKGIMIKITRIGTYVCEKGAAAYMGEVKQQTSLHFFDSEKVPLLKEICLKSIGGNKESEILLKRIERYITEKRGKRG